MYIHNFEHLHRMYCTNKMWSGTIDHPFTLSYVLSVMYINIQILYHQSEVGLSFFRCYIFFTTLSQTYTSELNFHAYIPIFQNIYISAFINIPLISFFLQKNRWSLWNRFFYWEYGQLKWNTERRPYSNGCTCFDFSSWWVE